LNRLQKVAIGTAFIIIMASVFVIGSLPKAQLNVSVLYSNSGILYDIAIVITYYGGYDLQTKLFDSAGKDTGWQPDVFGSTPGMLCAANGAHLHCNADEGQVILHSQIGVRVLPLQFKAVTYLYDLGLKLVARSEVTFYLV
jgi:hypothetical protein